MLVSWPGWAPGWVAWWVQGLWPPRGSRLLYTWGGRTVVLASPAAAGSYLPWMMQRWVMKVKKFEKAG